MIDFLCKRPMLLCAGISSVACVAAYYCQNVLYAIGIIIIIAVFIMIYRQTSGAVIFAFVFAFVLVLSCVFKVAKTENLQSFAGNTCKGVFTVIEEPEYNGDYYRTVVEVEKSDVLKKGTKISVTYDDASLKLSHKTVALVSLKSFEKLSDITKRSYYSEGIYLYGNMTDIEVTDNTDFILEKLGVFREYIKSKILKNYSFAEASTVLALITGDRSYFTDRFYSNVKCAGVAHVMVVSGMHLSVIVSLFLHFTKKFFYNGYLKALITFGAVILVAAVCGFTMSIMRAGVTYILICISLLINRTNTPSNTLGAAVSLILLNNPFAILSVAFQLSVLSTFGILVIALPVSEYLELKIKFKFVHNIITLCLLSVSATVMTAPITIYIFGYISNVSLITNLLISSAVTAAMVLCILGLLFPFFENVFFFLSSAVVKYVNAVINYFGELPYAVTYTPQFTAFLAAGVIIIVFWVLLACKRRIDMLKLKEIRSKKIKEGGKRFKWQSFMKKR